MNISLKRAIELIEASSAVIVDGDYITYPTLMDESEEGNDFFLCVSPGELDREETFKGDDNKTVKVDARGRLVLVNNYGEDTILTLLTVAPVKA